ncbi:unnamed protein product [Linum tenue]|uniref:ZF-HD dimerization-type domain-containing protein n=1 Tax=Linum tenue TaxID=586396 RepID=A0AAV0LX55_9ROSI|nr:unnamed protein product [Linum tenue]
MEEAPSNEDHEDIPVPINTSYGGPHAHLIHTHHHRHNYDPLSLNPPAATFPPPPPPAAALTTLVDDQKTRSSSNVRYRECLKNHAASIGGTATDGCGEFMPSGEQGTIEALTCSACTCHRNFHRKQQQQLHSSSSPLLLLPFHHRRHMITSFNMPGGGSLSDSDDHDRLQEVDDDDGGASGGGGGGVGTGKKRYRTRFSVEQKEKMLEFAEGVGWKIQNQEDDGVVQRFCNEIGVKRRVLKVWMHNNKHHHNHANSSNQHGGAAAFAVDGAVTAAPAATFTTSVAHPSATTT